MIYLLDTNVCVRYLNGRSPLVRQRLRALRVEDIAVCSVVKAELFYGALKSNHSQTALTRQQRFLAPFQSLPFDDEAALVYGRIRSELSILGTPIGANDYMIAAIAITHNLTLVTHNTREFGRVAELTLEDWERPETT